MATIKTNKQDVINNFVKYLGRQPNATEITKYQALPPTTLESDLKAQYQKITGHAYGTSTSSKTATTPTQTGLVPGGLERMSKGIASGEVKTNPEATAAYYGTTQSPKTTTPTTKTAPKQIYRLNGSIYDAATGQKIPDVATLQKDYAGATEVQPPSTPGAQTTEIKPFDYKAFGITDDIWNQLTDGTKAFVESTYKTVKGQYDSGLVNVSVNADLLNKAMANAATDPEIQAKYGDAFKLDQANLTQNLANINSDYAQNKKELNIQQEEQKKALAEQEASAGRAYSGFREQAKSKLATAQTGIIESSKRELQKKLQTLGTGLETTYGTTGLSKFAPITAGGESYQQIGGITGTADYSKAADIRAKGLAAYNQEKL